MIIAVLALVLMGVLLGGAGMRRLGKASRRLTGPWRPGVAGAALLVGLGGMGLAARGGGLESAGLLVLAAALAVAARRRPKAVSSGDADQDMSRKEALDILGLGAQADTAAVEAAHRRLMARVHPDVGGAHGLAVQLNRARDVLLKPRPR